MTELLKAVPEARDHWQSAVLAWCLGGILAFSCLPLLMLMALPQNAGYFAWRAGLVSLTFGLAVRVLRAATWMGALCGAMICLLVTFGSERQVRAPELHSGLVPLMCLFLLTFIAGKLGRMRKRTMRAESAEDRREGRRGRTAAQVVANLGAAGIVGATQYVSISDLQGVLPVMLLAALAEATSDTIASEIGSAFGGTPRMVTNLRAVPAGTDGAVTLLGTAAGTVAASAVVAVGAWALSMSLKGGVIAFTGACVGLIFDSLLGATLERRGWLGNDLVNFTSTVSAASIAFLLMRLF